MIKAVECTNNSCMISYDPSFSLGGRGYRYSGHKGIVGLRTILKKIIKFLKILKRRQLSPWLVSSHSHFGRGDADLWYQLLCEPVYADDGYEEYREQILYRIGASELDIIKIRSDIFELKRTSNRIKRIRILSRMTKLIRKTHKLSALDIFRILKIGFIGLKGNYLIKSKNIFRELKYEDSSLIKNLFDGCRYYSTNNFRLILMRFDFKFN